MSGVRRLELNRQQKRRRAILKFGKVAGKIGTTAARVSGRVGAFLGDVATVTVRGKAARKRLDATIKRIEKERKESGM